MFPLILSEKAAAQELRRRRKAQEAAEPHRSENTWDKGVDPLAVRTVGDRVRVNVIEIDRGRDRISLSIRQLEADPWSRVGTDIRMGDDVDATITKLMSFGAFARIAEGLEGLIHVSELSSQRVGDLSEVVHVGDAVKLRVVGVGPERRRLSLSIRQAGR